MKHQKACGFSVVEFVVVLAITLIVTGITVVKVSQVRREAQNAKDKANLVLLQGAYERAKLVSPVILNDNQVSSFAQNAHRSGLLNQLLAPTDLRRVGLAAGTAITNDNALFVLLAETNAVADADLASIILSVQSPQDGARCISGYPFAFAIDAQAPGDVVTKVEISVDDAPFGSKAESPFSWSLTPGPGPHTLKAKVYTGYGRTAEQTVAITVAHNNPPTVNLTTPAPGTYVNVSQINLTASASEADPGDMVSHVEFYAGAILLGTDYEADPGYSTTWISPTAGDYTLTARAFDRYGGEAMSDPVLIAIRTNSPPAVTLAIPQGTTFTLPATYTLNATASESDPGDFVARVAFYDGTNFLGEDTDTPFALPLSNPSVGTHVYRAIAYDNYGGSNTSATVSAVINQGPQQVQWVPTGAFSSAGGTATKTGGAACSGSYSQCGAYSSQQISYNGYIEATAAGDGCGWYIGLIPAWDISPTPNNWYLGKPYFGASVVGFDATTAFYGTYPHVNTYGKRAGQKVSVGVENGTLVLRLNGTVVFSGPYVGTESFRAWIKISTSAVPYTVNGVQIYTP